ncbi:MAG: sigma factor-like helix-turn-helix DNA-binding protein [Solirubrobacteraceae bacterium]
MTELDRLPPDQRAVLSLVLERGKSYSEVADMLAIPESTVRNRAHAALDSLANDPLSGDPARSGGLRSAASGTAGTVGARRSRPAARSGAAGAPDSPPLRDRGPRMGRTTASSRRAGALLLGGIVIVIVVVVVLLSSGGGKSSSSNSSTKSSAAKTSTSSATKPTLDKTIKLTAAESTLKANGEAYVLSEGARRAFYVAAQGLPPSSGFFYAVWLYNSPSSSAPLGRAPSVSSTGRMEGGGPLPTNAGDYHQLIITRETSTHPTQPGPVVLRGSFALH